MFEKLAYAAQPAQQTAEANPLALLFPFFLIFGIMYFFIFRPQQKQRAQLQKMVEAIKKGDRVVTAGGILGTVTSIQNDYVVLKVGDNENTKIEVLKSSISGLRDKGN